MCAKHARLACRGNQGNSGRRALEACALTPRRQARRGPIQSRRAQSIRRGQARGLHEEVRSLGQSEMVAVERYCRLIISSHWASRLGCRRPPLHQWQQGSASFALRLKASDCRKPGPIPPAAECDRGGRRSPPYQLDKADAPLHTRPVTAISPNGPWSRNGSRSCNCTTASSNAAQRSSNVRSGWLRNWW